MNVIEKQFAKLLTRPRILVVDDEEINALMLAQLFGDYSDIQIAYTGMDAVALAKEYLPDLILLDLQLPDINGRQVCEQLRMHESTRDIPIIFVTGSDSDTDELLGFEAGAVDYIHKPFNPMLTVVRSCSHILLKQQAKLLKNISLIDQGTQIPNKRFFEERFQCLWASAIRESKPISFIVFDVDHFKQYNDHYGHLIGDQCLKAVAQVIKSKVSRPQDVVARFGGEEFVALLPNTPIQGALQVAQEALAAVRSLAIPHATSSVPAGVVTMSAGVHSVVPELNANRELFFQQADNALYRAKREGRNRVVAELARAEA